MKIEEIEDKVKAAADRLRRYSLSSVLKPLGSRKCGCGKTISVNAQSCFKCSTDKAA